MEQNRILRVVYRATSSLISSCLALFCLAFVNQFTYSTLFCLAFVNQFTYSILFRFYFNPSNSNSIYPSFDAFDVLDAFDAVPGRGVSSIVLSCLVLFLSTLMHLREMGHEDVQYQYRRPLQYPTYLIELDQSSLNIHYIQTRLHLTHPYIIMFIFKREKRVDISIMVICYASDIIENGRRISELSNA